MATPVIRDSNLKAQSPDELDREGLSPCIRGTRSAAMKILRAVIVLLALLDSQFAESYPSSIIAVPTAAIKPRGTIGFSSFFATRVTPGYAPYNSEFGFEMGVLGDPRDVAPEGPRFGGIELGLDFLNADLLGTPNAYVKPLLNAKVLAITESKWSPSLAFGTMNVAPFQPNRSLNYVYVVTSKTLLFSHENYGRITLGLGRAINSFTDEKDPFASTYPVVIGTWPFGRGSKTAMLAGYESPWFNRFSFALDYFGGVSEVGEAALSGNYMFVKNVIGGIGVSGDNGVPVTGMSFFGFIYAQTHLF